MMSRAAFNHTIRPCRDDELTVILDIINAAAEAYRGVIPIDLWHEPYMPEAALRSDIAAGVGCWEDLSPVRIFGCGALEPRPTGGERGLVVHRSADSEVAGTSVPTVIGR